MKTFLQLLLEYNENIENLPDASPAWTLRIDTKLPSIEEIEIGVINLVNNKVVGPDNIRAELLKCDSSTFAKVLYPLIKEAWDKECF